MPDMKSWKYTRPGVQDQAGILNNLVGQDIYTAYDGDLVAGLSPEQQQYVNQAMQFGTSGIPGELGQQGMGLLGAYGQAADIYGQMPQIGQLDLDYAASVADNPYMEQMIDAASRDVMRNFAEYEMPGIAAGAWERGDLGGSRRGAYEAIAARGAQDRMADISSGLRGSAYQYGLDTARRQAEMNPGLALQSAQGLTGIGNAGLTATNQGFNMGLSQLGALSGAGALTQSQEQQALDAAYGQFLRNQQLPLQNALAVYEPLMGMSTAFGDSKNVNAHKGTPFQQAMQIGGQLAGAAVMGEVNPLAGAGALLGQLPGLLGSGGSQPQPTLPAMSAGGYGGYQVPQVPGGMMGPFPGGYMPPTSAPIGVPGGNDINLYPYGTVPAPNLG